MEPGFSEVVGTWNANGAPWGTVGTAEVVAGGVNEGSRVASVVEGTLAGAGGVALDGTMVEGRSGSVAVDTEGSGGVEAAVDEESTAGSGAED